MVLARTNMSHNMHITSKRRFETDLYHLHGYVVRAPVTLLREF
jgi:hypothetical protein